MMHKGNLQTHAVIEKLQIEDEQEQSKKQMVVQGPAKVQCRLSLSDTIVLQRFDSFILRDCYKNETFAIGKILKYSPYALPEQPQPITKELLKAKQIQEKERIRQEYERSDVYQRLKKTLKCIKSIQDEDKSDLKQAFTKFEQMKRNRASSLIS